MRVSVPVAPRVRVSSRVGGGRSGGGAGAVFGAVFAVVLALAVLVAFWWVFLILGVIGAAVYGLVKLGDKELARQDAVQAAAAAAPVPQLDAHGNCTGCWVPAWTHIGPVCRAPGCTRAWSDQPHSGWVRR